MERINTAPVLKIAAASAGEKDTRRIFATCFFVLVESSSGAGYRALQTVGPVPAVG